MLTDANTTRMTPADFLREFSATAAGRAILEEQRTRTHAARQRQCDALKGVKRDLDAAAARFEKDLAPLEAAERAARAKWTEAAEKVAAKQRDRTSTTNSLEQRIRDIEAQLVASADPEIDARKWALQRRYEEMGHDMLRIEVRPTGKFNILRNLPVERTFTNRRAIDRLAQALAAARDAFDRLKTENPADLPAAIAAIEATVPWDGLDDLEPVE